MNELSEFRAMKDEMFRESDQSPLTDGQKEHFKGLHYYPENPDLVFKVKVEQFLEKQTITMLTSTNASQTYLRYGRIKMEVDGQPIELTIYASDHGYFLPFVDALTGVETYGAGRYLDPHPTGEGVFLIDFNYAYNPYCAYNERWSCPLTPAENRVNAAIRAGEKVFYVDHDE